jgi:hypothetical protein
VSKASLYLRGFAMMCNSNTMDIMLQPDFGKLPACPVDIFKCATYERIASLGTVQYMLLKLSEQVVVRQQSDKAVPQRNEPSIVLSRSLGNLPP